MKEEIKAIIEAAGPRGLKVAWNSAPRDKRPPYVVLWQVGGNDDMNLDEPSGMRTALVQVDLYELGSSKAYTLAETIRGALSGYRGGTIYGAFLQGVRDERPDPGDIDDKVFGVQLDFEVQYRVDT